MKKSMLILAMLTVSSALYAGGEDSLFTREQILDVFSRLNPAVLERAEHHEYYRQILEQFLSSYHAPVTPENQLELMAVARNFDDSIRLKILTDTYRKLWLSSKMTGADLTVARGLFTKDVSSILTRVWAVTVSLREYQLQEAKKALKAVRKDESLSLEEKKAEQARLNATIDALKTEIKSFKKYAGQQIELATQSYVTATEETLEKSNFSVARSAAQQSAQQARQTENLQIKSKNKKPVAK